MSTYDDAMFEYLTKKDNFISAYEIYQKFPDVKEQLIKEFWLEVQSILKEKRKGTDWKVSDLVFDKKDGHYLELYCLEFKSITVQFDDIDTTPYYCLYINYEDHKNLDRVRINKYASNINAIHEKDWEKDNNGCYWKYLEDDFTNIETLKKILPENRDDFVDELAKLLFGLVEELKGDILKMCKMTKK